MRKILALSLAAVMVLAMAGCNGSTTPAPSGSSEVVFRRLYGSEVTTMNYLFTGNTNDLEACASFVDLLVEYDTYGIVQPALAESWSANADNTVWTFKIRQGVKWVDKNGKEVADVTAHDWVSAAHYVNDGRNDCASQYLFYDFVKNADVYYDQTVNQFDAENAVAAGTAASVEAYYAANGIDASAFITADQIGVRAVDDYTLEYTTKFPCPFFVSLLSYSCYMPVYGPFLEECGASFGVDNDNLLFNGAFILSEYQPQARRIFTKNPTYWDKDNVHIDRIERTYNAQFTTIAPEAYLRGEVDYAEISADLLGDWLSDPAKKDLVSSSRVDTSYSYFYAFNFEPRFDAAYEPDNWLLAVNNENFRQSLRFALDKLTAKSIMEPIGTERFLQKSVTPADFALGGGKDFTEYAPIANLPESFDAAKAVQYRDAAKAELTAAGATFPIKVLMPYNPATFNWDKECQVVEQQMETLLGKDYIDIVVEAGPSTNFLGEIRRTGKFAFMKCNWGADYADPQTWTDPFDYAGSGNSYNFMYTKADKFVSEKPATSKSAATQALVTEYYRMTGIAKTTVDDEAARFQAFAEAEAFLIDHAIVIPYCVNSDGGGFRVSKLNAFEAQYAPYGMALLSYKFQTVHDKPMSMAEFDAAYATWKTERAAALAKVG